MFASEGFEAVTMRGLAKRIEYSPTAIYHHFKDKESLLREICDIDIRQLHSALQHATNDEPDFIARLKRCAVAHVDFALKHRSQYRLLFLTPARKDIHSSEGLSEADRAAYGDMRAHFVQFIESGLCRFDDPDLVAQIFFCGVLGIAATFIQMGDTPISIWKTPDALAAGFADALVHGLLKQPETNRDARVTTT
jgi:AcrR family transcriptional regulator